MTRAASSQTTLVVFALVLWAVFDLAGVGAGTFWVVVASYVLAWAGLNAVLIRNAASKLRVSRLALAALVVLPLGVAWTKHDVWLDVELLRGIPHHAADRLRLQATPALAPSVVFTDHPQMFFVHAPDTDEVRVRFGPRGATLDAEALGHGLFRVGYDPRRHGAPVEQEGPSAAWIYGDGEAVRRDVQVVSPGAHPRWFCRAPSGQVAATPSEESDELFVVSEAGRVRSIPVGDGPTDCEFLDETRVAVSHRHGPTLWVLDIAAERVLRRVASGSASRLALSPDRSRLAVAEVDSVVVRSTAQLDVEARTRLEGADWIEFSDDETLVISQRRPAVLHRAVLGAGWEIGEPLDLGRPAVTMARIAGGVVIATTDYAPSEPQHLANHFVQDQLLHVDAETWTIRTQTLTARRTTRQGAAGSVDRGVSPMGIEVLADGMLRVTFAGTDEAWSWSGRDVPRITPLEQLVAPHGVVTFASGNWSVASPSRGAVGTFTPDGWRVVELAENSSRRRGEHGFYEATRVGISCQACHLHGDTDFALRNIGGRRLAPTLGVGGIAGTSPYLRDGSYPRLRDLDHLSQNMFRGFLRRDSRRAVDLENYMQALPRRRTALRFGGGFGGGLGGGLGGGFESGFGGAERDPEREKRGLDVFVQAQCPTCHAFPAFTHLGQIPLGALFPGTINLAADEVLDTPSLLSVSTHGPYLSDGRAEDLRAVLTEHNRANRHGDTDGLSEDELNDLLHFLEGL